MKKKALFYLTLILFMPMVVMASDVATTTATTTKSVLEIAQKDQKKEEIRKQLKDTIDLCSALVHKLRNLEGRMLERVNVLLSQDTLSKDAEDNFNLKQKKLNDILTSVDERINTNLPKLAENMLSISKPAKSVVAFKKEVNSIKSEITTAHKLVIEMINLIKRDLVKFEDTEATSTDQTPN